MNNNKWYLNTWFIALLAALWPCYYIPAIIAIILIILQYKENKIIMNEKKTFDEFAMDNSNKKIALKRELEEFAIETSDKKMALNRELGEFAKETSDKKMALNKELDDIRTTIIDYNFKKSSLDKELSELKKELCDISKEVVISQYNFSDYDALTSEDCKNKIASLKIKEKELLKSDDALIITANDTKKVINNNVKQIIRCFNAECDNIFLNVTTKNIDSLRGKVQKAFETLNSIFSTDGIKLSTALLDIKLEELSLVYTAEIKKEQEKEIQREIKEQMKEEQKAERELEKAKAEIEKDQSQFSGEINKLMKYLKQTESDVEKQLYVDKIQELENKLKELDAKKADVINRQENAKAGYVYVISNIGSFGEDIYKIGMTRRLEPMDRIKELSSASVPFEFDVHAMIFSDNAPSLENELHKHFDKNRVNKINPRKEFFRVKLDDIEQYVKEHFNNTTQFTKIPLATEYKQSLSLN